MNREEFKNELKEMLEEDETKIYISDNLIQNLDVLGFTPLPLINNHLVGYDENFSERIADLSLRKIEVDDLSDRESAFYKVCSFELKENEDVYLTEYNQVVFCPDINEPDSNLNFYDSFEDLFMKSELNKSLLMDIVSLRSKDLVDTLGENTLEIVTQKDKLLSAEYLKSIKDLDLDNDGTVDRIDSDWSRNSVQTQSDLSLVGNKTSKETVDELER